MAIIAIEDTMADSGFPCSKDKTHINIVVIGHVDSGKSTTTGRKHTPSIPRPREGGIAHTCIQT